MYRQSSRSPVRFKFTHPDTDEPLANISAAACSGPMPWTYPIYIESFDGVTDSDGILTIERFPNGKKTWIRVDAFKCLERKECEDLLDHFFLSDLESGEVLNKTNFTVERLTRESSKLIRSWVRKRE